MRVRRWRRRRLTAAQLDRLRVILKLDGLLSDARDAGRRPGECSSWRRLRWGEETWNQILDCVLPEGHRGSHLCILDCAAEVSWESSALGGDS